MKSFSQFLVSNASRMEAKPDIHMGILPNQGKDIILGGYIGQECMMYREEYRPKIHE